MNICFLSRSHFSFQEIPDERKRIQQLLEHILRGPFSRFNSFREALCDSNQKESVVDRYLSGSSHTVTDSRAPPDVRPQLCLQCLSDESKKLIKHYWSELVTKMVWRGMGAHLIALKHGFTCDQIKSFDVS